MGCELALPLASFYWDDELTVTEAEVLMRKIFCTITPATERGEKYNRLTNPYMGKSWVNNKMALQ